MGQEEQEKRSISIDEFRSVGSRGAGGRSAEFLKFMLENKGEAFELGYLSKKFLITPNSIKSKKSDWNREGYTFGTRTINGKQYLGLIKDKEEDKNGE